MVYILKMEREKVPESNCPLLMCRPLALSTQSRLQSEPVSFHFGMVFCGTTVFFFFHEINCQIQDRGLRRFRFP
jgi:hypothetical protein